MLNKFKQFILRAIIPLIRSRYLSKSRLFKKYKDPSDLTTVGKYLTKIFMRD